MVNLKKIYNSFNLEKIMKELLWKKNSRRKSYTIHTREKIIKIRSYYTLSVAVTSQYYNAA